MHSEQQREPGLDEGIAGERRARARVEEVHGHRVDVELAQREREIEQVIVLGLAEAHDSTAARIHARGLRGVCTVLASRIAPRVCVDIDLARSGVSLVSRGCG